MGKDRRDAEGSCFYEMLMLSTGAYFTNERTVWITL